MTRDLLTEMLRVSPLAEGKETTPKDSYEQSKGPGCQTLCTVCLCSQKTTEALILLLDLQVSILPVIGNLNEMTKQSLKSKGHLSVTNGSYMFEQSQLCHDNNLFHVPP